MLPAVVRAKWTIGIHRQPRLVSSSTVSTTYCTPDSARRDLATTQVAEFVMTRLKLLVGQSPKYYIFAIHSETIICAYYSFMYLVISMMKLDMFNVKACLHST